jgi:HAD superfamily hydrolase (TIGR01509 family)
MKKAVFWDFDGTLASSPSLWSRSAWLSLREVLPDSPIRYEDVRPLTKHIYPWSPGGSCGFDYKNWWPSLEKRFADVFLRLGLSEENAGLAAARIRSHILNPANYSIYPDAFRTLADSRALGFSNYLLSNNYPELPSILDVFGLTACFDGRLISALVQSEKPEPAFFSMAREMAGNPDLCLMVGDNPAADICGGNRAGMTTILVHQPICPEAAYHCRTLSEIPPILASLSIFPDNNIPDKVSESAP